VFDFFLFAFYASCASNDHLLQKLEKDNPTGEENRRPVERAVTNHHTTRVAQTEQMQQMPALIPHGSQSHITLSFLEWLKGRILEDDFCRCGRGIMDCRES